MPMPIRRVVTATDDKGRSYILFDGQAPNVQVMKGMGVALTDLWETTGPKASNVGAADAAARPVALEPPSAGTIFRVVEFPPDKEWRGKTDLGEAFASIGAGHAQTDAGKDPMQHITTTVDCIYIVSGEIWAIVDTGETLLRAGDVFVQRGTNHSWANRSDKPCVLLGVLIDAEPLR